MRKILTCGVLVGAAVLSACGSSENSGGEDSPTVVVTTSILGDIVQSALGDLVGTKVEVEVIVPVGADAHEFAPSAKQAEAMENADLLVVNGLGYEAGMVDTIANAVDTGTATFVFSGELGRVAGADPHTWLDPVRIATALADLPAAVSDHTGLPLDAVTEHVESYIAELTELDDAITMRFDGIEPAARNLVTNHDSLGQFADRYGFTVLDTIIPSVSTSAQASAAGLDDVLATVRSSGVTAIFADSTSSDRLAQALADELGRDVEVVELFTESLGAPGSGAETYIGMMTVDADRIATALA